MTLASWSLVRISTGMEKAQEAPGWTLGHAAARWQLSQLRMLVAVEPMTSVSSIRLPSGSSTTSMWALIEGSTCRSRGVGVASATGALPRFAGWLSRAVVASDSPSPWMIESTGAVSRWSP